MAIIYRPYGDTDLANAVIVVEGSLPQDVLTLPAGSYQVGRVDWASPVTVTDPVAPAAYASRTYGADAYLTTTSVPTGNEAITFVLDYSYDVSTTGSDGALISMSGGRLAITSDVRVGKGSLTMLAKDTAGASMFPLTGLISNGGALIPATRHKLVVSISANSDGSNLSQVAAWLGGVEQANLTGTVGAGTFGYGTTISFLNSPFAGNFYELSVYGGTHAEGFAGAGGDVAGLTLLHTISGDAAAWNAGNGGLVKAGVDLFT